MWISYDQAMAADSLCPKCGAYWGCNCATEELAYIPDLDCMHDWVEVVGVELDEEVGAETSRVYGCRLCGKFVTGKTWQR